jgi:hypothetical protein
MPARTAIALLLAAGLAAVGCATPSPAPVATGPEAAVDPDAAAFVRCMVVAAEGKRLSEKGRSYYGAFYTRAARHALALAPAALVREQLRTESARHDKEFTGVDKEKGKAYVNGLLDACEAAEKRLGAKLEPAGAEAQPVKDADWPPRDTDTIAVLAARGKPDMEDYNADGRFIYGWQAGAFTHLFLFDVDNRLIRIRHYCDKLKGACPE